MSREDAEIAHGDTRAEPQALVDWWICSSEICPYKTKDVHSRNTHENDTGHRMFFSQEVKVGQ